MGSAAGQTNGVVAVTVEAAAAAAADYYMVGNAAIVVAEAELEWATDFLESSEERNFEIGAAVTSASESN